LPATLLHAPYRIVEDHERALVFVLFSYNQRYDI
jgi:hypothetical protein